MPRKFADGAIVMVDDGNGISRSVAQKLVASGLNVVHVSHKPDANNAQDLICDLTNEDAVKTLFAQIRAQHGRVAALVHLLGLGSPADQFASLYSMFQLAKTFEPELNRKSERTLVIAAHRLGGIFGTMDAPVNVLQAGLTA